MVIALVALFFSLGGSAFALVITGHSIKNGTVTGADIKNGALASRDLKHNSLGGVAISETKLGPVPSAQGVVHQAVVAANGVLARSRGVTSASRTGEGRYQVIFDGDVRGCSYFASIGDAGGAAPAAGLIESSQLPSNVNGVSLRTQNSNGAPADRPFHLLVSC
jgi:hypothetical protein